MHTNPHNTGRSKRKRSWTFCRESLDRLGAEPRVAVSQHTALFLPPDLHEHPYSSSHLTLVFTLQRHKYSKLLGFLAFYRHLKLFHRKKPKLSPRIGSKDIISINFIEWRVLCGVSGRKQSSCRWYWINEHSSTIKNTEWAWFSCTGAEVKH